MNIEAPLQYIPLAQLRISPLNARKTTTRDVADLAASIAAHGLLQNLSAVDKGDGFEVVAGGRRLTAMQQLLAEGRLSAHLAERVPCLILVDDDVAHEASTAENTLREAMHPADQFDAFAKMVDEGKPIEDVAAHFGVSELVVRRRLKLARVAPEIIADFRSGNANLEQLMALGITDDQDAQRKVWFQSNTWQRDPQKLRASLTTSEIPHTDKRARLVGVEAYAAAGGAVRRDLFADNGNAYLLDERLLDRMFEERLKAEAEALTAEGWSFVRTMLEESWQFRNACGRSMGTAAPRSLSADEQAALETARQRRDALRAEIEASEENDVYLEDDDPRVVEMDELDAQIKETTAPIEQWTPRQMAKAGCLITFDHNGRLEITRGLIPSTAKAAAAVEAVKKPGEKKKPQLSVDMEHRLTLHRAAAAREHIAGNPTIALRLLLAHLVAQLITHSPTSIGFGLMAQDLHKSDTAKFDDVAASPASTALRARLDRFREEFGMPNTAAELYTWLEGLQLDRQLELLALVTASTMQYYAAGEASKLFAIDMAAWWTPAPETYLAIVPKVLLAEAVTEVAGKAAGEAVAGMKKDAAIAKAAEHLAGTGWLPKPLRGPGYKLQKSGSAPDKAAPTKPSGKKGAPAKKAASKAKAKTKATPKAKTGKKTAKAQHKKRTALPAKGTR